MGWSGKVAMVAGVGNGLGSALVERLASAGATTIGVARGKEVLAKLEARARANGWTFTGKVADLGRPNDVAALFAAVTEEFGAIDALTVTAGHWVEGPTLLHEASDGQWSMGLADNLDPLFYVCRAALPPMLARGRGSIVLVSATDRVRYAGTPSYCASKGAIVDLTEKLARDYRSHGIRVNAVLPGTMEHEVDLDHPPSESTALPLSDRSGVGAWEVARAIVFLLSDDARWISGARVRVDGGFSTHGKEQRTAGIE